MSVAILDEADVRRIAREELARPALVTSRACTEVLGIPRWRFVRDARDKRFPAYVDRRLWVARYEDAFAYYSLRIDTASAPAANDARPEDPESLALAKVGARRVAR